MDRLAGLWRRLRAVVLRRRAERELEEELRFHVEMETASLAAGGLGAGAARREALRAFGGTDRFGEEVRDTRGVAWLEDVWRDVRVALRQLRKSPQFSVAAILTLAIGIGATTAIFTAVDAVLLRASPFTAPESLVVIWETDRASGTRHEPASWPDVVDMRERTRTFSGIAAMMALDGTLTGYGTAERISVLAVTPDMADVLGVAPVAGRALEPGSGPAAGAAHGMLSERYWRSRFDADPEIVGSTLTVNGRPVTVVGVLPADADLGVAQIHARADYAVPLADERVDLWLALEPDEAMAPRETHPFLTVGRLAAGSSVSAAQAELSALMAELERQHPENVGRGVNVERHAEVTFGPVRSVLRVLMGGVLLVLLVACVNVANLLLARTSSRGREVALRSALGAGRGRLRRQFFVEGMVLALAGAAVGVLVAGAGLQVILALAPPDLPRMADATLNLRVLGFVAGTTMLVALAFAITPSLGSVAGNVRHTLASQAAGRSTETREQRRFRGALAVSEIALAVTLTIGAVLLLRSLAALTAVDPGFRPAGLLKAEYRLPEARYPLDFARWPDLPAINDFHARMLAAVRALPGVEHAALAASHPLEPGFTNSFVIVGREQESAGYAEIRCRMISPDYPATVGLPLMSGRSFTESDIAGQPPVALINAAAAAHYFDGRDPLGEAIRFWGTSWRIVGVIGDERFNGLDADAEPAVYVPLAQAPQHRASVLVRTAGDPIALAPAIHAVLARLDADIALTGVERMGHTIARSIARPRFAAALLGAFAAVAVILALIGVYGVLSYTVSRRTREMGIRMALGSSRSAVLAIVLRDGLRHALLGTLLGLTAAALGARLLAGILYGIPPHDPLSFAAVAAGTLILVAAACALPALRAARASPLAALRTE